MGVDVLLFYMYFSSSLWQFLRSFHLYAVCRHFICLMLLFQDHIA